MSSFAAPYSPSSPQLNSIASKSPASLAHTVYFYFFCFCFASLHLWSTRAQCTDAVTTLVHTRRSPVPHPPKSHNRSLRFDPGERTERMKERRRRNNETKLADGLLGSSYTTFVGCCFLSHWMRSFFHRFFLFLFCFFFFLLARRRVRHTGRFRLRLPHMRSQGSRKWQLLTSRPFCAVHGLGMCPLDPLHHTASVVYLSLCTCRSSSVVVVLCTRLWLSYEHSHSVGVDGFLCL